MQSRAIKWLMTLSLGLGSCTTQAQEEAPKQANIPFEGQAEAPDFPESVEWLNSGRSLSLRDLRGKVVLLDFWTYCCINCMHIIPDLKKLEAKYPKELVVIGVHSAKFANEKQTDNIREAIKRYEIEHPVINDKDFQVWRSYNVHSWPSLMLINPKGRIIGGHSGEGIFDLFDQVIGETIRYFDGKGLIDRKPIQLSLEKSNAPPSLLSYPGKIAADEKTKRLVFSDSNHNRVIVATLDGEILDVIGEGTAALKDGAFDVAQFFRPQGIFLDAKSDLVFVADTENHAIRQIDLKARQVKTLAGNGRQARMMNRPGKDTELNSPWDLVRIGDLLYIAMAGPHQLWTLDLKTREPKVYAGTGRENITDGLLRNSALAQPSGITTDGKKLYFADSEVSAVRAADLDSDGNVQTLIGQGLFEFGDVDGAYPKARLQHPLGVAFHEGTVYVADTYNHKIKRLNPATKELSTFIGTGKRGLTDGPASSAQLNEPSGLCFADGKMFIADANNHAIRVCDLKSATVSTMVWKNVEKLALKKGTSTPTASAITLKSETISPEVKLLDFKLALPKGKKINPAAVSTIRISSHNPEAVSIPKSEHVLSSESFSVPIIAKPGQATVMAEMTLYYCDAGNAGLCYFTEAVLKIPVDVRGGGGKTLAVNYSVLR